MPLVAAITHIQSYLPPNQLTNEQLAREYPDWDIEKIYTKTGINARAIAAPEVCASDLGIAAAEKLFAQGACLPDEIDFLLFCTQSPDYFLPTTSCLMQERLHLRTSCGALDFNLGCSGYIYGLSLAKGLVETGQANKILLITAETYSKYIHPTDRSVRTLFGDGAAATLISRKEAETPLIGPFVFGTDGRGGHSLIVPAGGHRARAGLAPACEREIETGMLITNDWLFMDGPEIFNFTLQTVPTVVRQLLEKSQLTLNDVDYFVFHQANKYMLDHLRKKLHIPEERFSMNLASYGNTVSSTIPMALELDLLHGCIQPGQRVMLVGFGVGFSWGATLVTFPMKGDFSHESSTIPY